MKCFTVLLFCSLLIAVAITLADAQSSRRTTPKLLKKTVKRNAPAKKKKSTNKKKVSTKRYKATTPLDEFSPDNEVGHSCYDSCYPKSKFLNGAGQILNPSQYGTIDEICGKTYLFGTKQVTWEENWKTCCSIGMMPTIFLDDDETNCLNKAVLAGKVPSAVSKIFWTGAFRNELQATWSWCTKDSPTPVEGVGITAVSTTARPAGVKERAKSVDDDFNCLELSLDPMAAFKNNHCNATGVYLACESVEKYAADLLPGTKCRATCNTKICKKNGTLFRYNEKQEMELMERYKFGRWVSKCGRYFLFSKSAGTYLEAKQKCCSYGAQLLSIKTIAKRRCLSSLAISYGDVIGNYWTSGMDRGCDGNFRWCSVDRAFLKNEVQWGRNEPSQTKGDCVWTRISAAHKNSSLFTDNCETKRKFICEVRQSGTTVQAVQKECLELLGLTPDEKEGLKSTGNYTYKMKCYLRCIGDNLGMLIDGNLQEGNVMKLMEKSNDKSDMDSGYEAIDECKKKKNDTDSCQSAYQMYMCGKIKAPVVFGKMVLWEEVMSEEETAPVEIQEKRTCDFQSNFPTSKNISFSKGFLTNKITSVGGIAVNFNGLDWYKSEPAATNHSYLYAHNYCASLGMTVPYAPTFEDFKKLYDFMNGSSTDLFFLETESTPEGEKWCGDNGLVPTEASDGGFKLLSEKSILYSKKGLYKLVPVAKSMMDTQVQVKHFYCQPTE